MNKPERLQKIIAQMGVVSRREAEKHIRMGDVTVNGKVAQLGDKATLGKDHIKFNGKLIQNNALATAVLVLYKPRGVLPLPNKEGHVPTPSVFDIIPRVKNGKLIPVGRLDTDTEGILLFTNDGALAQRLSQSKYEVPKVYKVKIDGLIDDKKMRRVTSGLKIEGKRLQISSATVIRHTDSKTWIKLETTESQNRIVRKLFEHLAHPIDKLSREKFAGIGLKGLNRGESRFLTENELRKLLNWVGLEK